MAREWDLEDLESKVDEWHKLPDDHPSAKLTLPEYLGMTEEEYGRFALLKGEFAPK